MKRQANRETQEDSEAAPLFQQEESIFAFSDKGNCLLWSRWSLVADVKAQCLSRSKGYEVVELSAMLSSTARYENWAGQWVQVEKLLWHKAVWLPLSCKSTCWMLCCRCVDLFFFFFFIFLLSSLSIVIFSSFGHSFFYCLLWWSSWVRGSVSHGFVLTALRPVKTACETSRRRSIRCVLVCLLIFYRFVPEIIWCPWQHWLYGAVTLLI